MVARAEKKIEGGGERVLICGAHFDVSASTNDVNFSCGEEVDGGLRRARMSMLVMPRCEQMVDRI